LSTSLGGTPQNKSLVLQVGHEVNNLTMQKMIMLRSPKWKPRPNFNGCSATQEEDTFAVDPKSCVNTVI